MFYIEQCNSLESSVNLLVESIDSDDIFIILLCTGKRLQLPSINSMRL